MSHFQEPKKVSPTTFQKELIEKVDFLLCICTVFIKLEIRKGKHAEFFLSYRQSQSSLNLHFSHPKCLIKSDFQKFSMLFVLPANFINLLWAALNFWSDFINGRVKKM